MNLNVRVEYDFETHESGPIQPGDSVKQMS